MRSKKFPATERKDISQLSNEDTAKEKVGFILSYILTNS